MTTKIDVYTNNLELNYSFSDIERLTKFVFSNPFVPGKALIESRSAKLVWVHGTRLLVRFEFGFFQPII